MTSESSLEFLEALKATKHPGEYLDHSLGGGESHGSHGVDSLSLSGLIFPICKMGFQPNGLQSPFQLE